LTLIPLRIPKWMWHTFGGAPKRFSCATRIESMSTFRGSRFVAVPNVCSTRATNFLNLPWSVFAESLGAPNVANFEPAMIRRSAMSSEAVPRRLWPLLGGVSLHDHSATRMHRSVSSADRDLLAAAKWRAYIKSVFKKGFMYKLSCKPSVVLYVVENKTLAGKEDRSYEGEAMGRKLALAFFEQMDNGLVRRVRRDDLVLKQFAHPCRAPADSWRNCSTS
jgi:hypothetical protein